MPAEVPDLTTPDCEAGAAVPAWVHAVAAGQVLERMSGAAVITDQQIADYERDGACIIDGPFVDCPSMLDWLEAGWDALHDSTGAKRNERPAYLEPAYVHCIAHPFFEAVAKRVLKAEEVGLYWSAQPHARPPSKPPFGSVEQQWKGGHIDIQATLEDFDASPRRMRLELWHFLNDVPTDRGAMRV